MTSADSSRVDPQFLSNAMASFLQIGAVLVLLYWCFTIVAPFLGILIWALIIGVAIYPAHVSLTARLGGREKLSATLLVLAGLAIILVPTWFLGESALAGVSYITNDLQDGAVDIPPPSDAVRDWPVIGERAHALWSEAATNLQATLNKYSSQLTRVGESLLAFAGSFVGGVFQFVFSTIIAGAFLMNARRGYATSREIADSLIGVERGQELTDLSILTIRSVTKGVLGVAVIQAILAAIGLLLIGIPGAGLWAGAVLVLAIVQLPPILVLGPIAFWYFSVATGWAPIAFLVYALVVSGSDAFLKPMLLGRGLDVPMLVILIGAIGGAITEGIVGLFIGAVVLALGYKIVTAWMAPDHPAEQDAPAQA